MPVTHVPFSVDDKLAGFERAQQFVYNEGWDDGWEKQEKDNNLKDCNLYAEGYEDGMRAVDQFICTRPHLRR